MGRRRNKSKNWLAARPYTAPDLPAFKRPPSGRSSRKQTNAGSGCLPMSIPLAAGSHINFGEEHDRRRGPEREPRWDRREEACAKTGIAKVAVIN